MSATYSVSHRSALVTSPGRCISYGLRRPDTGLCRKAYGLGLTQPLRPLHRFLRLVHRHPPRHLLQSRGQIP